MNFTKINTANNIANNIASNTANKNASWKSSVPVSTSKIRRTGLKWVGGFALIFGLWSTFMPLSAAIVAIGSVVSQGQNKLIQHSLGGTVVKIHARDGQRVKKGAPIITLDRVSARADLERLESQRTVLRVIESRLKALVAGQLQLDLPVGLTKKASSSGLRGSLVSGKYSGFEKQLLIDQRAEFIAARKRLNQELTGYQQKINSIKTQMRGYKIRQETLSDQMKLVRKQYRSIKPLARQGYVARARLIEIEKNLNDLVANLATAKSQFASSRHQILEIQSSSSQAVALDKRENNKQITQTRGEIDTLDKQIAAAQNTFSKLDILAPVSGIVTKSTVHTIGGVVPPGVTVAEIVPGNGRYIFEARVLPKDIDSVKIAQAAEVTITAFNARLYDPVKAVVAYVAADSQTDQLTGQQYFVVRLKLAETASQNNRVSQLRTGMEAEVFIRTEGRTFLSYVFKPISDSFRRAFREQ